MTRTPAQPHSVPAELRPYLREVVHRAQAVCGPHLVSVVAVGSVALGDYPTAPRWDISRTTGSSTAAARYGSAALAAGRPGARPRRRWPRPRNASARSSPPRYERPRTAAATLPATDVQTFLAGVAERVDEAAGD